MTTSPDAIPPAPLPNSYWLPGRRIAAGEYPGVRGDPAATRAKLGRLLDAGVRTFVDLTAPHDPLDPYDDVLADEAARRGVAVAWHRLTIADMGTPSVERMREILDAIGAAAAEGGVYVHCWGGRGRTGTAVGCWLVRQGRTGEQALETLHGLFSTMQKVARDGRYEDGSPQTDAQRRFVREWARHEEAR